MNPNLTPPQSQQTGISLELFSDPQWFAGEEAPSIWVQMFTVVRLSSDEAKSRAQELARDLDLGVAVRISLGIVKDFNYPVFDWSFYAEDSGQPVIKLDGKDRVVPDGTYVVLSTPFRGQKVPDREYLAKQRLARVSALVGAHFGYNFIRHMVFDGEILSTPGQYSIPSESFRVPQPTEGPFFYKHVSSDLIEIASKLRSTASEIRQRIELALEFFDRSFRDQDQFFNAWIALEVLCNGKSQKIRSRIQGCYQLTSVKAVDQELGFGHISRWRHEYFHKGMRPVVGADVERYLQLLFLDLLRYELGLEQRRYAADFATWKGVNLSTIGLEDRRTVEQLAAAERLDQPMQEG